MAKQNTMIGAIQSSRKGEPRISIPRMTPDAPKPQLRRVSPGVYRNDSGDLVGSRGQRLPGQRQPGIADAVSSAQGAANDAAINRTLERRAINAATDAAGQMGRPDWVQEAMADPKIQGWLDMMNQGPKPPSVVDSVKASRPQNLNREAQDRANALRSGGMVTGDVVPQRDNLVRQILAGARPNGQQPGQMPNDMFENLRRLIGDLAPSSPPQQRRPQPGAASGFNGTRTIQPWERAKFGIDPRDPNMFWVGPDGKLGQTLIGWSPNPMPMDFPKIPTALTTNDFLKRLRG